MINNMKQPDYLYMWELDLDAVLTRENGNDIHTPITALVTATDAAQALLVWMENVPLYIRGMPGWHDAVSARAEHVNSTRILCENSLGLYILD